MCKCGDGIFVCIFVGVVRLMSFYIHCGFNLIIIIIIISTILTLSSYLIMSLILMIAVSSFACACLGLHV